MWVLLLLRHRRESFVRDLHVSVVRRHKAGQLRVFAPDAVGPHVPRGGVLGAHVSQGLKPTIELPLYALDG